MDPLIELYSFIPLKKNHVIVSAKIVIGKNNMLVIKSIDITNIHTLKREYVQIYQEGSFQYNKYYLMQKN